MGKEALIVDDVSMKFNLSSEKVDNFKEYIIKSIKRQISYDEFWSLKHVSFSLEKGDRMGILGLNGAGKSTLLKVISGVYKPTEGHVIKHGKVVPLLELGAGFDSQYTGRENIFLYGTVLGYSKSYLEEKYDEIVEFSELGRFIDVPIKNYSSGMKSKLGFSIATIANPDILILDEVLSVGDARFKKKSEAKIMQLMEGGTTVLFVSHSLEQVRRICNKAMILDHGTLKAIGDIDEISAEYSKMIGVSAKPKKKKTDAKKSSDKKASAGKKKASKKKEISAKKETAVKKESADAKDLTLLAEKKKTTAEMVESASTDINKVTPADSKKPVPTEAVEVSSDSKKTEAGNSENI